MGKTLGSVYSTNNNNDDDYDDDVIDDDDSTKQINKRADSAVAE